MIIVFIVHKGVIISVRQTVDMIGKPLEINISTTCIKPCNGNVEHVG